MKKIEGQGASKRYDMTQGLLGGDAPSNNLLRARHNTDLADYFSNVLDHHLSLLNIFSSKQTPTMDLWAFEIELFSAVVELSKLQRGSKFLHLDLILKTNRSERHQQPQPNKHHF